MIIGRENEIQELKGAFESEYSEFVVVYGRRRVGKTYLIRETFDYTFTFQHSGVANVTKREQIKNFVSSSKETANPFKAVAEFATNVIVAFNSSIEAVVSSVNEQLHILGI